MVEIFMFLILFFCMLHWKCEKKKHLFFGCLFVISDAYWWPKMFCYPRRLHCVNQVILGKIFVTLRFICVAAFARNSEDQTSLVALKPLLGKHLDHLSSQVSAA